MGFNLMRDHNFEINVGESEYAAIKKGITSAEPALNETVEQDSYFDGDSFSESDVVGAQLVLSFSGHRQYQDAAQNYIFGKALTLGQGRRTDFKWTEPDGGVFSGACTIANIEGPSGEAASKGEISFEIHFNGKPEYTPPVEAFSQKSTSSHTSPLQGPTQEDDE